jgi:precorrin-8X/cobalt-precorrin-8 methylmutase
MSQRRPDEIIAESFRIIDAEVGPHGFDTSEWPVARRMIHAAGDVELAKSLRFHNDPVPAGVAALKRGTPIVTDVTMVLAGINAANAYELRVPLRCFLNDPNVEQIAQESARTRSFVGMEHAITEEKDAIYVIGNAPTALLALCAAVRDKRVRPALIVAVPVGFVAVAESKEEALALPTPVISIVGRKGGSAIAAAAVNALLLLALEDRR